MTVSSTLRKAGPFNGNGVTTAFPFAFKVFAKTDIEVVKTDAAGVQTTLVLDSDYSVALNVDQDSSPGGTITYPVVGSPLPIGQHLDVVGSLVASQPTDITNLGRFLPQVEEDAFDRGVILVQQLEEKVARALIAPAGDTADLVLPTATVRANKTPVFDDDGNLKVASTGADVQLQVDQALAYKEQAGNSATESQVAQGQSEAARDAASVYASLAATGAKFYNTIALGIAGTASGSTFGVIAGGSDALINPTVYRNDAGVATKLYEVPQGNADAAPRLSRTVDSIRGADGAFIAGTRANGLRVRWNNPDGRRVYSRVTGGKQQVFIADKLGESQLTYLGNNTAPEITVDKILFTSDRRGTAEPYFMGLDGSGQTPAALLITEHWQVTGQSLASGDQAAAALSTVNVDSRAQMLSLSVAPPYGPRTMLDSNPVSDDSVFDLTKVTGLTPLVEAVKNVRGETICSGFVAQYLKGQAATEKLVIDDHARGAAPYTNQGSTANPTFLSPGSMHFANGNLFQELARKYVEAAGGAYRYAGMLNIHGHADANLARGRANYLSDIQDWRLSYNGQARHRSALHRLQPMFLSQMSNLHYGGVATQQCLDIALAQMDAHQLKTGFWLVTPAYFFPMVDDTHFTAAGNRLHGEYFGKVARRVLKEGVAWEPVYPKSWTRAGNVINVQFNVPVAPLVFDTSTVTDPGQGGFSYTDDTASGITVTGVAVAADGVSVNVTLSGTGFGTNPRFRIAGTQVSNNSGPVTGARSTLRDSDSEKGVLSGTPLYNYACIFEGAIV